VARIVLNALTKRYGDAVAVRGIDLEVASGEFVVLVGPSGCGKSTTLRMVAGLEDVTAGDILIDDVRVNDVPPRDRNIAMVFQDYALYPHMTVFDNMAFGLRQRGTPKADIPRRVENAAATLGLAELLHRKPAQLSGGQRQRVAMGRAMVREPRAFLFDEPLSNLDAKLRVQMRAEIKALHGRMRSTVLYVTHDQVEAMTLADRIVVMNGGIVEQVAPPQDMYERPATRFVAGFIGSPAMNFIPCSVVGEGSGVAVRLGNGDDGDVLPVPADRAARYARHSGQTMLLGIRPEHVTERRAEIDGKMIQATVQVVEPLGMDTLVLFEVGGTSVCARIAPAAVRPVGETMPFFLHMDRMHLIDPTTDRVI